MEVKKKSVLFIAGTLGQGGAEKQLFLLAKNLKNNGHRVEVASFTKGEYWEKKLIDENIFIHDLSKQTSRVAKLIRLSRLIKEFKFEIIYAFHFYTSLYAGFLGIIFRKVLTIGSIRSNGLLEIKNNGFWSVLHAHSPKKLVSNNKIGKYNISKKLNLRCSNIYLLNNAIKLSNNSHQIDNTKIENIVFIGRLVNVKDPFMLIGIVTNMSSVIHNISLDVYGYGPLINDFKERINAENLSENIILHGSVENANRYLNTNNILITTSLHEGTPNVVLEALAAGSLVVARNFDGIEELLTQVHPNYSSLIFSTPKEAAIILGTIITSPDQFNHLRDQGIEFIKNNYSLEKQYKDFIKIIEC